MQTFTEFLDSLPIVEKRRIKAAEREYLSQRYRAAEDPADRAFFESMSGYSDPPAGVTENHNLQNYWFTQELGHRSFAKE